MSRHRHLASFVALTVLLAPITVPAHAARAVSKEPTPTVEVSPAPTSRGAERTDREPSPEVPPLPAPSVPDPFASALRDGRRVSGLTAHRALHFTFDDGPGEHTPALLDVLDEHGVHATFFLVARQLRHENGRRIAREIMSRGHTIGLHSYRHDDLTRLDDAALRRDLDRSERAFEEALEARPWLFRPPYGRRDARVDAELAARGYTQVLWNITTSDGDARSADEVVVGFRGALDRQERMRRGAGGIVVFHDTHPWVVDAMPQVFEEIEARNCALLETEGAELWDVHADLRAWHERRGRAAVGRSARRMHMSEDALSERQGMLRERARATCPVQPRA